ncbi:MAG: D,D-dipeptide ABC transporter permease, partial [Pseudomonadota bacterium]
MTALRVWLSDPNPASRRQARLGQAWLAWQRIQRNRLAMAGLIIVAILLLVAAFAPLIAPHDPLTQDLTRRLLPP